MSRNEIEKRQKRENVRFELATRIRDLLDEARKAYGPTSWDEDGIEDEIADLVFGE